MYGKLHESAEGLPRGGETVNTTRALPLFFLALAFSSLQVASRGDSKPGRYTFTERHMGTRFQIILYAPDEKLAQKASAAAFRRISELNGIMSDYHPTSELMRLCQKAGGEPVRVSADLFYVLSRAQEVSRLSGGAFDVTVGPVVRLWRRARRTKRLPDADKLAAARALVGYQMVRLDPKMLTVQLTKKGMLLDLGGIGKGFAADAALEVLHKEGIDRALVAAGGDIAVSRRPPGSNGWKVGIAPLLNPNDQPKRYLLLENGAVSTSGDAEQHVKIGGKRYSHIVDPRTGLGLVGRLSATVVARKGIDSDSLTKVVAVLGTRQGLAIIDRLDGVSAYLVRKGDQGEETFASRRFPGLSVEEIRGTAKDR
jgi:thiamine biosynthesis lipoprotein